MLIPHVGDLAISGSDAFIAYLSGRLANEYGVEVFEENEATCAGVEIRRRLTNSPIAKIFPAVPKLLQGGN